MEENNNTKTGNRFALGILVGILIGVLGIGVFFGVFKVGEIIFSRVTDVSTDNVMDGLTLSKIKQVKGLIDRNLYKYNEDVTTEDLEDGIIRGMIESLGDSYAEYFSTRDIKKVMDGYEGISYGIGCYVSMNDDNQPVIAGTVEGSPAEEAKLREGDIIVAVNNEPVRDLLLSQVVRLIKGPEDTEVNITILRGEEYIDFTLIRKSAIENTTVNYGVLSDGSGIGYLRITGFEEVTYSQYKEAMEDLKEEGIKGLILDLRSNPGGDLNVVVDIAREILPEGLVVYTENNRGIRKEFRCKGEHELDIPLVVLVNSYSASASEILAGAIKDHNKGTLIGTTTFGKGIVQSVLTLSDGSAIKITTSSYFTPNGVNIHGVGIEPDIELELDYEAIENGGEDNQVEKAIEVLKQKIGE